MINNTSLRFKKHKNYFNIETLGHIIYEILNMKILQDPEHFITKIKDVKIVIGN